MFIDTDGYEVIRIDQKPSSNKWKFIPLYKINEKGNNLMCQIGYDGVENKLLLINGNETAIHKEDGHTIVTNNSGRSLEDQAYLEASNEYKKRFREKGYRPHGEVLTDIMLMRGVEWNQSQKLCIPFGMSPKLDGVRGGMRLTPNNTVLIRSSKNSLYEHLNHLREEVKQLFMYLPPDTELDGEIYNHRFILSDIISIVKTNKTIHPNNKQMNYYIFDFISSEQMFYEERYDLLKKAFQSYEQDGNVPLKHVFLLPLYLSHTVNDIDKMHEYFTDIGYEGSIIRSLSVGATSDVDKKRALYQSGKCNHFYKYKKFKDEEGTIVGMEQGQGRYLGAARLVLKDPRGNMISVLHHGTVKEKKEAYTGWLENNNDFIGRLYKYKYQELTENGIPRHPTGLCYRDID
jgi:ATP-dependent DNA ligase